MDKEYTGHITGKHYLAMKKNDIGSFVVLWMNLECVIQRELNQKKNPANIVYYHIHMESRKMAPINLFARQIYRLVDTAEGSRRGWEKWK